MRTRAHRNKDVYRVRDNILTLLVINSNIHAKYKTLGLHIKMVETDDDGDAEVDIALECNIFRFLLMD